MKKLNKTLSLLLAVIMIIGMLPMNVLATTDYTNGTDVSYTNPNASEGYTVTVPASMKPGATGSVKAEGTWASNRQLVVTADMTVTLTNSINENEKKVLDVTFEGIVLDGSNTAIVSEIQEISVANIKDVLFGVWSGVFYYTVSIDTIVPLTPGLYQTGAIEKYLDEGAAAIEGMLIKSWQQLLDEDVVQVEDGVFYTIFSTSAYVANPSADVLDGDLIMPSDGSITALGNTYWDSNAANSYYGYGCYVGHYAFTECAKLTGVLIPESVSSISCRAFKNCKNLMSIDIPNGVTTIGFETFANCTSLSSVTLPETLITITAHDGTLQHFGYYMQSGAFSYCTSLTSISIPDSVVEIGTDAFNYCDSLSNVSFGENSQLNTIGWFAFNGCDSLLAISIPDSVVSIEYQAFCNSGLTTISFGNNSQLTSIGESAFWLCENLSAISIPRHVSEIGESAFARCTNLANLAFKGTVDEWNTITKGSLWSDDVLATQVYCEASNTYVDIV